MILNKIDRDLFRGNAPDNNELARRINQFLEQARTTIDQLILGQVSLASRISTLENVTVPSAPSVSRYTTTATLTSADFQVAGDTDGGDFTISLPPGVNGREYRIVNTGTSGNVLTITPDGSELLLGANSSFLLRDQEALKMVYHTTEGWL